MSRAIHTVARLVRAGQKAHERKWSFLVICVLVFVSQVLSLASLDLLPQRLPARVSVVATTLPEVFLGMRIEETPEMPLRIQVPTLGLDASIISPTSSEIAVLDAALLQGAVRHPTSARLGENGNVVVFGHSSYLPVVHNQAYKIFDGIQDLKVGETVVMLSAEHAYTYRVVSVVKANAESDAIPLDVSERMLTLATCDSFGTKSDRFVVTALFVEKESVHT